MDKGFTKPCLINALSAKLVGIAAITLMAAMSFASEVNSPHAFFATTNLISNYNTSDKTWLAGDLGRYEYGGDLSGLLEANFAYRYRPGSKFQLHVHMQGRESSESNSARKLGLIELEARYRHDIDFSHQLEFNLGQFFLPTSMENTERFWESPYTINFSSLNSWIGEEFRPVGLDSVYRYHFKTGERLSIAGTLFRNNDSMGSLLAYRGWSYGRFRSMFGDVVALPALAGLADGQPFDGQRDDGTKPFGRDLDDRTGIALRGAYDSDRLVINLTWVDNKGDTRLLHREYAWRTKFAIVGASWFINQNLELLGEATKGNTTMGAAPGVDVDFYSYYLMASYFFDDYRLSYRYDQFGSDDLDSMDQDNHDLGRSQTLAIMWQPQKSFIKAGAEVLYLDSKRRKNLESGIHRDSDSISLSLLLQYRFM